MVRAPDRRVVIVSGTPASGKTSMARPLAKALGFPLLSKDDIKEPLFMALGGPPNDEEYSHRLGHAAMEVLWALACHCPQVVLEANFRTRNQYEREKVARLGGRIVELHCRIDLEEAKRRFAQRARNERKHPAHAKQEITIDELAEYAEPFGLNPVIEVDSTQQRNIEELIGRIRMLWDSAT
jgi:glucokinase